MHIKQKQALYKYKVPVFLSYLILILALLFSFRWFLPILKCFLFQLSPFKIAGTLFFRSIFLGFHRCLIKFFGKSSKPFCFFFKFCLLWKWCVDDTPGISIMEMRNKCRRLKAEQGLDLIVVDYLQLMTFDGRADSRQQEISALSRHLKLLAREMNCPVIVLSQLSRAPELRQDKRPMLSDLRESGSIEQDADIVMFLYRDDYYNENTEKPGVCEINIAKHRSGPTDRIDLTWVARYTKFSDKAL